MNIKEIANKIINKTTSVTVSQRKECLNFIKESFDDHLSHNRDNNTKFQNMLSKLAEYAVKNICEKENLKCSEIDIQNHIFGDGGIDLWIEDLPFDVKQVIVNDVNQRMYVGKNEGSKFYICVLYYEDSSTYKIHGIVPSTLNFYFDEQQKSFYCLLTDIPPYKEYLNDDKYNKSKSPLKVNFDEIYFST
jgi:hypothetical protein